MSLTRAAIERNRVTLVALLVVTLAGIQAFLTMPQAEDPGFIVRTALVLTHFPGASPERVELLVTDKLEKAIQEIPELDYVHSQSKTGISIVYVNVKESYDHVRPIWDDLRRKVDRVRGDLPEGTVGPFVNDEFGDVFGTIVTLTGDGFSAAELEAAADDVRDELLLIGEVAKVEIYGAQEERVFVEYNNATLARLGLSPLQLKNTLEARNITLPGGEVRTAHETIVLEPSGNFESVDELRRTLLTVPGSDELIYLGDVARVERGYVDPARTAVRVRGLPGLALAVSLREGGNIVTLGEEVRRTLDRLQVDMPLGLELGTAQFQADAVQTKVDGFVGSLVQAVLIVVAVMLLSLGLRTGLVVASLIPAAIVASFVVMSFLDIGLDQMSLASLIIALGMLVDNAIVMSESILVQMQEGKPAKQAAIDSAAELRVPLLTSSLTTAAAFLPIYLAESTTGEYTAPLFKVVTITLLCSWVLALTLVPLLCVKFLRVEPGDASNQSAFDTPFYRGYRGALLVLLRHRWLTVAGVAAVFVCAMGLFRFVPVIFFPPNDRPTLTVELRLPVGTPLAATSEVVTQVEAFLAEELAAPARQEDTEDPDAGGVVGWTSFLGQGAPRFILSYNPEPAATNYAILLVDCSSRERVDAAVARLNDLFGDRFPGLKATVQPLPVGPPSKSPIEVRVSGRDADRVFALVDTVKERLRRIAGTRSISDDWGARSKKLVVTINQAQARRAGVTNQDVAISLQTLLSGFETTEYREADKVIPVTLRSVEGDRLDLGKIESLNVYSQLTGRSVPLRQVARLEVDWQPSIIRRRGRLRTVTVESDLEPGVTAAQVNGEMVPWLERESRGWPPGTSWELGGESESSAKANASIVAKLPVAGLIIVLLLVGQFNSIRRPLIILITIPLGLIGVVVGLLALRSYFGFMTLLGIISLAGIVINNAIVLLDRIRIEIEDNGLSPQRAVVESAQRRLRPILLTTFTTLGGLVPLYLGGGPMWEPMAVAIMFGLVFATALTLGVVPVLYSLFFRVRFDRFDLYKRRVRDD
ncbi:MAG: efflux RND transporter permease subunit [Acidobacteriota bacterium]|jgi:multidrug efflux pump subunit AcrB